MTIPVDFTIKFDSGPRCAAHAELCVELGRLTPELRGRLLEMVRAKIRFAEVVPFWEALERVLQAYGPTDAETGHVANILVNVSPGFVPQHLILNRAGPVRTFHDGKEIFKATNQTDEPVTFSHADYGPKELAARLERVGCTFYQIEKSGEHWEGVFNTVGHAADAIRLLMGWEKVTWSLVYPRDAETDAWDVFPSEAAREKASLGLDAPRIYTRRYMDWSAYDLDEFARKNRWSEATRAVLA